jgi:hypothetical protein
MDLEEKIYKKLFLETCNEITKRIFEIEEEIIPKTSNEEERRKLKLESSVLFYIWATKCWPKIKNEMQNLS